MNNREALEGAKPKTAVVELREGLSVRIRELTGTGRLAYYRQFEATKESGGMRAAQVAALALCEDDGTQTFDPTNEQDMAYLDGLSGAVLEQIAVEFYRLSGLTSKAVDDAAKN